jgi:hypothetical protein
MRLSESQLRKIIREELLKEMNQTQLDEKLHLGAIAGGLATGGAMAAINWLLNYVQTHPIGHDIAVKIQQLSDAVQAAMEE